MSGHSKWATIHRQKGIKDAARGQLFSKLARAITIAAKTGGGPDPDSNYKLRMAIDKAREANMPKDNVDRAVNKGSGDEVMDEVVYEGFGPGGIAVMVDAVTDNRNRTGQEIKGLFERVGGNLVGPGAVAFNFDLKGLLIIEKQPNTEAQMLSLIDMGVDDMEETDDAIEVYVESARLSDLRRSLEGNGFVVKSAELTQRPKSYQTITNTDLVGKALNFLDDLTNHDDVQKVYANLDVPSEKE